VGDFVNTIMNSCSQKQKISWPSE